MTGLRLQISEVLEDSLENLDKYKIVAGQQPIKREAPVLNPYKSDNDTGDAQDLKALEKS